MAPDDYPPTRSRRTGVFVAVGALVALMLVLHLTGVVGAGMH